MFSCSFIRALEDTLFRQKTMRRNIFSHKREEVFVDIVDEFYAELDCRGGVDQVKVCLVSIFTTCYR